MMFFIKKSLYFLLCDLIRKVGKLYNIFLKDFFLLKSIKSVLVVKGGIFSYLENFFFYRSYGLF